MLFKPPSRGTLQGRATLGPGGPEPRTGGQDRRQRQSDLGRSTVGPERCEIEAGEPHRRGGSLMMEVRTAGPGEPRPRGVRAVTGRRPGRPAGLQNQRSRPNECACVMRSTWDIEAWRWRGQLPPRHPIPEERPVRVITQTGTPEATPSSPDTLRLRTDPCGTGRPLVMQGYTGTFSSPNYPQNYPAKRTCSWRVKSDARGRQLWLVFDDRFSIEHYKKCEYDYLKIYDGPDENAPLVKTLCDEEAPPPVNLTGNDAFVKFKSDQAITKTGFRITWRTCPPNMLLCDVGSVCLRPENRCDMTQHCQDWTDELNCVYGQQNACGGQVLADGPGNITTVNYPVFFPPGLSCTWNIVAAPGKRLRASFTGIFDVPCLTAVKVREVGPTRNKPNKANGISTFCGRRTPSDIIVTVKERLRVHFQPPMVIPGKGFALTWETSCQENYFSCPEGSCLVPEKVCDGADDCQQGEDESYPACPTTAPPTSTPIVTTGNDGKPESETALTSNTLASNTLASNTVTPGKWSTDYHTASQTGPIRQKTIPSATSTTQHGLSPTSTVREGIYKASSATPQAWTNMTVTWAWNGTLGGSTSLTTQSLDTYPSRQCYSCHDDGACASPVDSAVPVTECLDDQACWVIEVDPNGNELESEDTSTFCGSQTPPDVIVTDKERLKIDFQPPMAIPGKGFALTWETSCQENYFSCPEGSCLVPEKVCDGADDCQQGEDESEFLCADTTASPSTTPIVTTYAATTDVDRTPTPTREAATPGNWHNYTTTVGKGIPNASAPTPHWTGSLADSTVFTALPSDDYSIENIDTYPSRQCYSCHDDGACASPVDSTVPVTECLDDQDCWVERILGPGRQKERIVYRRGCGSLCPEYWEQEDCMDGWVQVCKVCCSEDLCNSQLLNGDDKRFSNQVSEPNMVGVLQPNWIHLLVASLSTVCMFTA
ncbi:PREDICTED: uncharacterized protein LOC109470900 [Branchiostoma belcheri]|uniref:Uncharacterized protein LOC109470900 n=1 Tax=Branchiostoma belcheri TaxID=7741 RepID=A0A6P4Y957_BRABE|nr:PREDICTED: uncharacterized protein LOC109470900 [Branchiostoma belcheri]